MMEIELRMYHLLLFVAYRIVNRSNERDMAVLKEHQDFLMGLLEGSD